MIRAPVNVPAEKVRMHVCWGELQALAQGAAIASKQFWR